MTRPAGRRDVPTRLRILDHLRRRRFGAWTLDELAEEEHIDRSVAFEHLEVLVAARLAAKEKLSHGRGRPMNTYRYAGAEAVDPPQRTQLLATALARALGRTDVGPRSAHDEGRDIGSRVGTLARLGGEYVEDDRSVHALSCMFESSCQAAREVVCSLHAGLIEGAMSSARGPMSVTPAGPDGLGGCRFDIEDAGGSGPRPA